MTEIEETLRTYLAGYAGLTALVSTRIYPLTLPQNAVLPALTYQRVSGPRVHSSSGVPILAKPRLQLDCWGRTYAEAKSVAAQVRAALDGHQAAADAWASVIDNDIDNYEPETGRYRVIVDVLIHHSAT